MNPDHVSEVSTYLVAPQGLRSLAHTMFSRDSGILESKGDEDMMDKHEIEFEVRQRPDNNSTSIKNRDELIECVEGLIKCLDDGLRSGIGAGERHRGSTLSAANQSWRRGAYGPQYLRTVSAFLFRAFANGGLLSKYNLRRKSCEE